MKRMSVILLNLFTLSLLMWAAQVGAQQTECGGVVQAHRLVVGWGGFVMPGDPNSVREQPSISGRLLGQLRSGTEFNVLEGPVCADGLLWWRVESDSLTGWTAQGDGTTPWLQPILPTSEPPQRTDDHEGPDFDAFDVSFSAHPSLVAYVDAERTFPPYALWAAPPHRLYRMNFHRAGVLTVYAVSDLETFYRGMPEAVLTLSAILDDAPSAESLAQLSDDDLYIALPDYIQFQNGAGYRYITSVAADNEPTTYAGHFYRYYGLTSDRQFYLEFYYPLSLPFTADSLEYMEAVRNPDVAQFQSTVLNQVIADPTLIRPSLSLIDELVASINVHDAEQTVAPLSQSTPTPLPPPTITPTPTPTLAPTATPDGCFITAINDVNLRVGPDVTFEVARILEAGETIRAIRRYTAGSGQFIYMTEEGSFVHEDFITGTPLCDTLPVVEQ